MKTGDVILHLNGLRNLLWMAIVSLVGFSVFALWILRDPERRKRDDWRKKDIAAVVVTFIWCLGFVVFYANVNLNPKIAVSEGMLVRRATRLISYEYYFDIGKPFRDTVSLSTFSASEIVPPSGLSVGSRYRYYYEERTGEILAIERIASE